MRGRAEAMTLGPFAGGLNTYSDPTAIADNELSECDNFDFDFDGSLIARPGVELLSSSVRTTIGPAARVVGKAFYSGTPLAIIVSQNGLFLLNTDTLTIFKTIATGSFVTVRRATQYRDYIYVITISGAATSSGGSPGYYNLETETWTATTTVLPGGVDLFPHKGRIFVLSGNSQTPYRLFYSGPVTDLASWKSADGGGFIDISPGDGQAVTSMKVYNDDIVVFKRDSTYVVAYDLNIAEAYVRVVNAEIGGLGHNSTVAHENSIFVFHGAALYELSGYNYLNVSTKVSLTFGEVVPALATQEVFLSVFNHRIIVNLTGKYYVYNILTKTWSTWSFDPSRLPGVLETYSDLKGNDVYLAGGYDSGWGDVLYRIAYDAVEEFTGSIATKTYDLSDSVHYKKLMWWAIDMSSASTVTGNLEIGDVTVSTETELEPILKRRTLRFLRTARFKSVRFSVDVLNAASNKIFNMTILVSPKQVLNKRVNQ